MTRYVFTGMCIRDNGYALSSIDIAIKLNELTAERDKLQDAMKLVGDQVYYIRTSPETSSMVMLLSMFDAKGKYIITVKKD